MRPLVSSQVKITGGSCRRVPSRRKRTRSCLTARCPQAEIARLSRNYVSQLGADETRFGMCRDYLWMQNLEPSTGNRPALSFAARVDSTFRTEERGLDAT